MKSIAVIGGGITGVTSAYALARRGFSVTLFEQHRYAATDTSFANGGQLSASNAEVWTHGSTILKGLKWMLRGDAPLLVNPRPTWHKLSWFAEFIAHIPKYRENTIATARMAIAARQHLFAWAEAEGVEFDLKKQGILHIYRDRKGFDHAGEVSRLLAAGGLERRAVTPEEMRQIEPTLAGDFYGGYFTESDSTGDIHKFTTGLAAAFERHGGRCLFGALVKGVASNSGGASVDFECDGVTERRHFDAVVQRDEWTGCGHALSLSRLTRLSIQPPIGWLLLLLRTAPLSGGTSVRTTCAAAASCRVRSPSLSPGRPRGRGSSGARRSFSRPAP